ncbi:MAG: class I SAM-dependent methyltransferase [Caldilineaceae bacterium]
MAEKQISSTAMFTTMLRAVHQTTDSEPKILVDPVSVKLAEQFEGTAMWAAFGSLPAPLLRVIREALVLRNRFTEDVLQEVAIGDQCQYVILGAGFDTFAYRQPSWVKGTRIFEVDHPATQEAKRTVLHEASISVPENLYFCPVDFQQTSLRNALAEASFEFDVPSVFSWLGVTQYITQAAIQSTLEFIRSLPQSSTVVLSFIPIDAVLDEKERQFIAEFERLAAARGEPFLSRFDPKNLQKLLGYIGFSRVSYLSPEEAQERYFKGRADGLAAPSLEQLMRATV